MDKDSILDMEFKDGKWQVTPPPKTKYKLNLVLFFLTLLTTHFAGAFYNGYNPFENPIYLIHGASFSFTLMAILLAHEMGHYIMSKRNGMDVTLPYFIPAPPLLGIGTFGAFIKIKSPIYNRNMLIDTGASGPLAGLLVTIPVLWIGLAFSHYVPVEQAAEGGIAVSLGSSLLMKIMQFLVHGLAPAGHDLSLHPIAFAGWIGLLVTCLNLIPVGQLDGGHVMYALFGKHARRISRWVLVSLVFLGFMGWNGWWVWAVLLFLLGTRHPPLIHEDIPVDRNHRIVGWIAAAVFILTFIPVPISIVETAAAF
jgi:membrane-associated protease RseP (regulator of RpoE activity)